MFHISHRQSSRPRRSSTPRKSLTALIMFFFCSTSRGWLSRQHQPPYPWCRALSAVVRGAELSAPRPSYHSFGRPITYCHHHLAEPSAPMPTPWAEPLALITTTLWPSRQHRGNINHDHHLAEPSAPMP